MPSAPITLTSSMRQNLLSLQSTSTSQATTQNRLATGLKVNSALDNPANYFAALSERSRATDLAARKDGLSEAIQTIKSATAGIDGITALINNIKGLLATAASTASDSRSTLAVQYSALRQQINNLQTDSNYKGTNLLGSASNTLSVIFNETGTSTATVTGFDAGSSALGLDSFASALWVTGDATSFAALVASITSQVNAAVATLRAGTATLSTNISLITIRSDFSDQMTGVLNTGADNLTVADQNEEGANLLALQTRQQLGVISLNLASQANQAILRLF